MLCGWVLDVDVALVHPFVFGELDGGVEFWVVF